MNIFALIGFLLCFAGATKFFHKIPKWLAITLVVLGAVCIAICVVIGIRNKLLQK